MTDRLRLSLAIARGADAFAFTIRRRFGDTIADLGDPAALDRGPDGGHPWSVWRDRARGWLREHEPDWRTWPWEVARGAVGDADPESAEAEWREYVAQKLYEELCDEAEECVATVGILAYEKARLFGHDDGEAEVIASERMAQASEDYWRIVADALAEATETVATTVVSTLPRPTATAARLAPGRPQAPRRVRSRARSRRVAASARSPGRSTGDDDPEPRPPLTRREAGA